MASTDPQYHPEWNRKKRHHKLGEILGQRVETKREQHMNDPRCQHSWVCSHKEMVGVALEVYVEKCRGQQGCGKKSEADEKLQLWFISALDGAKNCIDEVRSIDQNLQISVENVTKKKTKKKTPLPITKNQH